MTSVRTKQIQTESTGESQLEFVDIGVQTEASTETGGFYDLPLHCNSLKELCRTVCPIAGHSYNPQFDFKFCHLRFLYLH